MEEIPAESIKSVGERTVRMYIPMQEGFSLEISNGELVLYLPSSVLAAGIKSESTLLPPPVVYSTLDDEAERLGFSERTLRNYMKDEKLPFIRTPGGDVRFIASEIDTWMSLRKVNAQSN